MKILLSLIFLSIFSTPVFSQQIETLINGRMHNCFPVTDRPVPPGNPYECTEMAYRGPYTKEESIKLCDGAKTTAPAECALKAYAGPYTKEESFKLCLKAVSAGPAECALFAFAGPFTKEESRKLCNFPDATIATAECAIKAFAGIYTRDEALRICATPVEENKPEGPKPLSKESFETLVIKANEKAMTLKVYKK